MFENTGRGMRLDMLAAAPAAASYNLMPEATAAEHAAPGAFSNMAVSEELRSAGSDGATRTHEEPVATRTEARPANAHGTTTNDRTRAVGRVSFVGPDDEIRAGTTLRFGESGAVPAIINRGGDKGRGGTPEKSDADSRSGTDKPPDGSNTDSGQPPEPPHEIDKGLAGDDGNLPPRAGRDEESLSPELRDELDAINRMPIERAEDEDGSITLALDDQNRSRFEIEVADTVRVATGLDIQVDPELQDLGIGRRLARATADEFVRRGVDMVELDITDETELRTMVGIFGNAIKYMEPFGTKIADDENITHQQALDELNWYAENTEISALDHPLGIVGIQAIVDMRTFLASHPEYVIEQEEFVLDRCDFNHSRRIPPGEIYDDQLDKMVPRGELFGEVRHLNQRLAAIERNKDNPDGLITPEERRNSQLVLSESFANYEEHVRKHHPLEHYFARVSIVHNRVTNLTQLRLNTYFSGHVRPGVVDFMNLRLQNVDPEMALAGQSRDPEGRRTDELDQDRQALVARLVAQPDTAEPLDLSNAELKVFQQSGRGLYMIWSATNGALCREFNPGGGFVYNISPGKMKEVVRTEVADQPDQRETVKEVEIDQILDEWPDL